MVRESSKTALQKMLASISLNVVKKVMNAREHFPILKKVMNDLEHFPIWKKVINDREQISNLFISALCILILYIN